LIHTFHTDNKDYKNHKIQAVWVKQKIYHFVTNLFRIMCAKYITMFYWRYTKQFWCLFMDHIVAKKITMSRPTWRGIM